MTHYFCYILKTRNKNIIVATKMNISNSQVVEVDAQFCDCLECLLKETKPDIRVNIIGKQSKESFFEAVYSLKCWEKIKQKTEKQFPKSAFDYEITGVQFPKLVTNCEITKVNVEIAKVNVEIAKVDVKICGCPECLRRETKADVRVYIIGKQSRNFFHDTEYSLECWEKNKQKIEKRFPRSAFDYEITEI